MKDDGVLELLCSHVRDWLEVSYSCCCLGGGESDSLATTIFISHTVRFFFLRGSLKELVYPDAVTTQTDLVVVRTLIYLRWMPTALSSLLRYAWWTL
ncbi:hypothetical protein TNCV_689871 [Trichonephila clavipes]|nr:hypothetical protein TNCV_689871 [Trichonephila clavipes]